MAPSRLPSLVTVLGAATLLAVNTDATRAGETHAAQQQSGKSDGTGVCSRLWVKRDGDWHSYDGMTCLKLTR